MKKGILILLVALAAFSLTARGVYEKGSGNSETRVETVQNIDGVHLAMIGTLHIMQGDREELVIEGDDNLLPYIETEMQGKILVIRKQLRAPALRPKKKLAYYLTVREIASVKLSGSGDAAIESLKADNFDLKSSGSGDITADKLNLAGDFRADTTGSGGIRVKKLSLEGAVTLTATGSGDIEVADFATNKTIETRITGSGDISAEGRAYELKHTGTGAGSLEGRKLDVEQAQILLTGSGNADLGDVAETISARLTGSGDLVFGGRPRMDEMRTTGSGEFRQR